MPVDEETRQHLIRLQDEAIDTLGELSDIFPPSYRLTLVARNMDGEEDTDIVLTNDVLDDVTTALEKNKLKMENAQ